MEELLKLNGSRLPQTVSLAVNFLMRMIGMRCQPYFIDILTSMRLATELQNSFFVVSATADLCGARKPKIPRLREFVHSRSQFQKLSGRETAEKCSNLRLSATLLIDECHQDFADRNFYAKLDCRFALFTPSKKLHRGQLIHPTIEFGLSRRQSRYAAPLQAPLPDAP